VTEVGGSRVVCLICGESFCMLSTHLKTHGTNVYEYEVKFPGAPTISKESQEIRSRNKLGNKNALGHSMSKESKLQSSETHLKLFQEDPEYAKSISKSVSKALMGHEVAEETRRRISAGNTGKTMSKESKQRNREAHLGKVMSEDARQNMSIAQSESYVSDPTRSGRISESLRQTNVQDPTVNARRSSTMRETWKDPRYVEAWSEGMKKGLHTRPNGPETVVLSTLSKHFPGEWKYTGGNDVRIGRHNPDFMNVNGKKQVIEVFGVWWHSEEEVEPLIVHYKKYGFNCLVIWEYDVFDEGLIVERVKSLG